jgi:hypothetical protein
MGGLKLLLTCALALLAIGLVACGDDEDSGSATTPVSESQAGEKSADGQVSSGDSTKSTSGGKDSNDSSGTPSAADEAGEASKFVPKQHSDSGGGSEKYRVKGGDNSVQEFGEETTGSEFEEASAALHNFLDARAAGNWAAACSYMADSIVKSFEQLGARSKELEGAGCAVLLEKLTNQAALPLLRKEAERADVASLRIEDEQAFVLYRGLDNSIMAIPMTVEGGDWKVSGLAGTPLN